jgi:hypothetical protein
MLPSPARLAVLCGECCAGYSFCFNPLSLLQQSQSLTVCGSICEKGAGYLWWFYLR